MIDPVQMTVAERISAQDPVAVAVAPDDTRAYVASSRGGTVTVVDMASGAAVDRPVGALPSDVVAAGRHVYVALAASRTIAVLTPDGVVTGTVRLPTSAVTEEDPVRLGVTPDETTLLTLDPVRGELYLVDPSTSTLLATLGAAAGASMLRMSADGRRAYVVATTTHEVAEIDVAARAQVATVPVGCTPARSPRPLTAAHSSRRAPTRTRCPSFRDEEDGCRRIAFGVTTRATTSRPAPGPWGVRPTPPTGTDGHRQGKA
ncbi:YncE family protein [Pseudonocardia benzenivorans]